jgi:hypothetical protein
MNPSQELIPLSLSQREVWIDQRLYPESPHLNIGGMGTLTGELDYRILIDAANRMASESASLRLAPDSTGSQVLLKAPIVKVIQKDFSDCADPEEAMRQWYQSDYLKPISLDGKTPPWHLTLMKLHTKKTGLLMKFHHTVMDGWGIWLFYRRWAATYTALAKNQNPTEESSHRCYISAIQESNGHLQSHAFEKARYFWQSRIPTIPPPIFDTSIPNLNKSLLPFSRLRTPDLEGGKSE